MESSQFKELIIKNNDILKIISNNKLNYDQLIVIKDKINKTHQTVNMMIDLIEFKKIFKNIISQNKNLTENQKTHVFDIKHVFINHEEFTVLIKLQSYTILYNYNLKNLNFEFKIINYGGDEIVKITNNNISIDNDSCESSFENIHIFEVITFFMNAIKLYTNINVQCVFDKLV